MPEAHSAKPKILLDGREFEEEPEFLMVEDHLDLPDMFEVLFRDPARDLIEKLGIKVGSELRVLAGQEGKEATELLIAGEITALEAQIWEAGSFVRIRGYDYSFRLNRKRKSKSYRQVYDADIAKEVAKEAGLGVGEIEQSPTRYEVFSRVHLTDWETLQELSKKSGMEVLVEEKKLTYRKPKAATEGAPPTTEQVDTENPLQLVMNGDLEMFQVRLTSNQQYKEVEVRGWDPQQKKVLVGNAQAGSPSASLSKGFNPKELASAAGDLTKVVVDRTLSSQAEVDAKARAEALKASGNFLDAEGTARGNPKLKAGARVSVSGAGPQFDGKYTVTTSRHVVDRLGYKTHFVISGGEDRSLMGLVAPKSSSNSREAAGLRIGIVTNLKDPNSLGRVKVKFPTIPDEDRFESDWVRVIQMGASKDYGMMILPEVGDEVVVGFEGGDPDRPIIIGSVYNGKDRPKLGDKFIDPASGKVNRRGYISRKGHQLIFHDGDGKEGVSLSTGDKGLKISLNKSNTVIKISSSGEVVITGGGDVSVEAGGDLELTAGSDMAISAGGKFSVTAGQDISQVAGTSLDLQASANASIKGGASVGVSAPKVSLG